MFIYFAGLQGGERSKIDLSSLLRNRLISYHYQTPVLTDYYLERFDENMIEKLIMDSGAFSAWNSDTHIDFNAYIEYCLEYQDKIKYVVNLDVIPAVPGQRIISKEERELSAMVSYGNARRMIAEGIPKEKIIHVFHQHEDFKWLERMVENFNYIGLSPANDRTTEEKMKWLDACMAYVTDEEGFPIIKMHGFAVTAYDLIVRYPWFSVDSATWCQESARGLIYMPSLRNGKHTHDKAPLRVRIGFNSPIESDRQHFVNYSPIQKNIVIDYLACKGYTLGNSSCQYSLVPIKKGTRAPIRFCRHENGCEGPIPELGCVENIIEVGVINDHYFRSQLNVLYFQDFQESVTPYPHKKYNHKQQGFNL